MFSDFSQTEELKKLRAENLEQKNYINKLEAQLKIKQLTSSPSRADTPDSHTVEMYQAPKQSDVGHNNHNNDGDAGEEETLTPEGEIKLNLEAKEVLQQGIIYLQSQHHQPAATGNLPFQPAAKRGRGRPPKNPLQQTSILPH